MANISTKSSAEYFSVKVVGEVTYDERVEIIEIIKNKYKNSPHRNFIVDYSLAKISSSIENAVSYGSSVTDLTKNTPGARYCVVVSEQGRLTLDVTASSVLTAGGVFEVCQSYQEALEKLDIL